MTNTNTHPVLLIAEDDNFSLTDNNGIGWDITAEALGDGTHELCLSHQAGHPEPGEEQLMVGPMAPGDVPSDVQQEFERRLPEWRALAAERGITIVEAE